MRKESILSLLTVFVHYISRDWEIDWLAVWILFSHLLCLLDELVPLVVSVREHNHHEAHDNLLLFLGSDDLVSQYFRSEQVIEELSDHLVDVLLGSGSQSSTFLDLLPWLKIRLLNSHHFILIEFLEFFFIKFSHYSKARSIEEEIKLFIIFLRFGLSHFYLGHFDGSCGCLWINFPDFFLSFNVNGLLLF